MDTDGGGIRVSLIQKPHIISNTSNEPVEADEDRGDVASRVVNTLS